MKASVAVVDSRNENKIVFSGTHMECVRFVNINSHLYGKMAMRYVLHDGNLGPKLRPFLWER